MHQIRLFKVGFFLFLALGCLTLFVLFYTVTQLPSVAILEDVQLQVPLKIVTRTGELIAEYGEKRRTPLKIEDIPKPLIDALIATEDRRFYEHKGVDVRGLLRAVVVLISTGSKEQGGSTITMQVARNFFLSRHKTYTRKLNEILLALKIENELPKEKILELYLNKIYFGKSAYGVAAAAEVYYGKTVQELTLDEIAMLAGLPQAPSAINPLNNPKAALKRRDHVLSRMLAYGFITQEQYTTAFKAPLTASYHARSIDVDAPFVAEMVRQELVERYGEEIYTSGYSVYTTIDSSFQKNAQNALENTLLAYDKRHGYRGPVDTIDLNQDLSVALKKYPTYNQLYPVVITKVDSEAAHAQNNRGESFLIPFSGIKWTGNRSPLFLVPGHVVYIQQKHNQIILSQPPIVGGALVALDPNNGGILALVGGYDFQLSKFNRVTQAQRQPGSNFKPFIYEAAFEQGYTPASIINDAPLTFKDSSLEEWWRPQNDNHQFYGPTRLRLGLTLSRNLVSIRLLQAIGVENAIPVLERFGFDAMRLPAGLSLALGTLTATPLEMVTAYATFANGGYRIYPNLIHHIEDVQGHVLYEAHPITVCEEACMDVHLPGFANIQPAARIISEQDAYIMTHILQDAIQTGTSRSALSLGRRDLAGKTGTTNNHNDAWYSGYNRDLVVTTWMGYDSAQSLGEYAAQTALPMWIQFMGQSLKGKPESKLPRPEGIVNVKIDPNTSLLAHPNQKNAIVEIFKTEQAPTKQAPARTPETHIQAEDIF